MSLPLVIINPTSAQGATAAAWPAIASDLRTHFGSFTCVFTEMSGHATELAAAAARKSIKMIVACGGDGTISEVASGIVLSGTNAELGIMPSGTGGDFRKTLGIPARSRDAACILREGRTRQIDVGRVTYTDEAGEPETRHFLGVASFGMSAEIVERVKKDGAEWLPGGASKWLGGQISFGASMLQSALQSPATKVIVQLDDAREQHLTVANLCVANARYFGGGMKIAPEAKLNDGQFDVISIGDLGTLKILANAPRIYLGSHLTMEKVSYTLARKVFARPAREGDQITVEVDGELPGRLPATFQILPQALRVRCPQ